jgi:hypothetical protein
MAETTPRHPRALVAALTVSLALNLALFARGCRGPDEAPRPTTVARASGADSPAGPAQFASHDGLAASSALSSGLAEGDPRALRDLLDAAGVDPKLRRQLVLTMLMHRYEARFRSLYQPEGPDPAVWWRDPDPEPFRMGAAQVERMEAGRRLQEELQAEAALLLGERTDSLDLAENPWFARQYAGLPSEKAEALHRLQLDYQELEQQIRMEAGSFELPADQEKLRLLREEREKDLNALLSPEERAAWELRASPTADRTRSLATRYRASEDEYHRIFALQQAFDAEFERDEFTSLPNDGSSWARRETARKRLELELRAIVGEERYLAAQRESDSDFVLARAAADRLGLPPAVATEVHGLRAPVAAESGRIASDARLNPNEKRAALAQLAVDTRERVAQALGAEAADAFFRRGGMSWLETVERGSIAVATEAGVETRPLEVLQATSGPAPWSAADAASVVVTAPATAPGPE